MNSVIQNIMPMFDAMKTMRDEWLNALTDSDLSFNPGGTNKPMGELLREMGEVNQAYIESFKTFKHNWAKDSRDLSTVEQLQAWFGEQDNELNANLSALSDDDMTKTIERDGYPMPIEMQMQAYLQALLIYFGKATIYLRAMDKQLPSKLAEWVW
jgi:uncharacterized damage-inducible protein DinB